VLYESLSSVDRDKSCIAKDECHMARVEPGKSGDKPRMTGDCCVPQVSTY
jgi:hypothetical protein